MPLLSAIMDYDSPGSLVAAALQAKPTTRLGGSDGGAIGESNLVQTYLERIDTSAKDLKVGHIGTMNSVQILH